MITLLSRNCCAWVIMKPRPLVALICSPTTSASIEKTTLSCSPVSAWGSAPGSTMCLSISRLRRPRTWPSSPSLLSTPRMPANVLMYIGNRADSMTNSTLGSSPMPNQTMNSGISPSSGTLRSACRIGSAIASPMRLSPVTMASSTPTVTPIAKPTAQRSQDTSSDSCSVP